LMAWTSHRWKWLIGALALGWSVPVCAQVSPPSTPTLLAAPQPTLPGAPAVAPTPGTSSDQQQQQQSSTSQPETTKPGSAPSDALRASYDAAFQASLDNPADPQVLVKFAEVAVQMGDIEGAISALERLLLVDGQQADVKLELGVLYYRLGSTEAAKAYLEAASSSPEASDEVKERAQTFLKAMASK
jgi:hypothetical protein